MNKFIIVIISATLFAVSSAGANANHPVDPSDVQQVETGGKIYSENCVDCHGDKLQGPDDPKEFGERVPPRLDSTGHASHHSDKAYFDRIVKGTRDKAGNPVDGGMPAFGEFITHQQVWAVISYIKSRWPDEMRHKQDRMNPGHGDGKNSGHHKMNMNKNMEMKH